MNLMYIVCFNSHRQVPKNLCAQWYPHIATMRQIAELKYSCERLKRIQFAIENNEDSKETCDINYISMDHNLCLHLSAKCLIKK